MLGFVSLAAAAFAGPVIPDNRPLVNSINAIAVGEDVVDGNRAVLRYDNWTNPGSLLTGLFRAGTDEIADDCTLVGMSGPETLDTMGINCANIDAPSNLTGGQLAIRFYDLVGGTFIGGFNANLPVVALAAGGSTRLSFADGALTGLNITIPATGVYISQQWVSATFSGAGALSNLGYQTRGPINLGSSTDNLYNVTLGGGSFNFAGAPVANTGLKLSTVPEPASLGLLVIGALALIRRR